MSRAVLIAGAWVLLALEVAAGTPIVKKILPRGARRGTELEINVYGENLGDVQGLIFFGPGLEVLSVTPRSDKRVQMQLKVRADCPLGEHLVLVRGATGLANLKTFHVGTLPELDETEKNDRPADAQEIPLDVTVNGLCTREDRDCYRIRVEQPTRLSVEVQGVRLGDVPFDPYLEILDDEGRVLAEVDDTPLGRMDPHVTVDLESAGSYVVRIREAAGLGSGDSHYRLHVGTFPRPAVAFPTGVKRGAKRPIDFLGGGAPYREIHQVPRRAGRAYRYFPTDGRVTAPTPVTFLTTGLKAWVEPQEDGAAEAPVMEVPFAVDGIIARPGEVDRFRFRGKKGDEIVINVFARYMRSPLDAVLEVERTNGQVARASDDSGRNPDSRLTFGMAGDGVYAFRVRDHLGRGGADYVYHVEAVRRQPGRSIRLVRTPADFVPGFCVPRGGRMAFVMRGANIDPGRVMRPLMEELPKGVVAAAVPFSEANSITPILLEAAADAPLGSANARFALSAEKGKDRERVSFAQTMPLVRVDNNQPYHVASLYRLPIAVTEPTPFTVELLRPTVPIVPDGPLRLKVRVHRRKGFDKPVTLRMLWNPPGIGSGRVTAAAAKAETDLIINANGRARPGSWKIAVVGSADVNGLVSCSSALVDLTISEPWVTAKIGRCRAEPGGRARLDVEVDRKRAFTGPCQVSILNLPRDVKGRMPEVPDGVSQVSCDLTFGKRAPAGRRSALRLEVRVPSDGGMVLHRFRGGELRIDKPLRGPKKASTKTNGKKAAAPVKGTVANPKT